MTGQPRLQIPTAGPAVDSAKAGMSARTATGVEFAIIGLALVALILIFQPFSLALFGVGCGVVVVSGLANNLLPFCEPGVPVRSLVNCGLIVGGIFVVVLIISITSAYLYGRFFVGP
jgi:hypothetical protein